MVSHYCVLAVAFVLMFFYSFCCFSGQPRPSWGQPGQPRTSLRQLGATLGQPGPTWGHLGPSGNHLGGILGHLGANWGPTWDQLGPAGDPSLARRGLIVGEEGAQDGPKIVPRWFPRWGPTWETPFTQNVENSCFLHGFRDLCRNFTYRYVNALTYQGMLRTWKA